MHIESSEWTPEESGVVMGNAEASGDGGSPAALILIAVIAVLMLAGLLRTIRRLRGKRITSEGNRGEDSAVASMGITQGVGRLWRGIRDRVAFAYQLLRHRDSAGALFVMTERRLRRKGLARSVKETPSAYLRRLSDEIQKKAESKVDGNYFCQLADILERQYYRGQATALPEGFAEEYRRLLRAYIRSTEPRGDL
jgi:hypothetical protein